MSDLVENPEDRFSRVAAHIIHRAHSNVSVEYGGNGKVRNKTSEDNTLQATSSRFSLFICFYNAPTQNKRTIDRAIHIK